MSNKSPISTAHPLGELSIHDKNSVTCDTYSWVVHVEWDENSLINQSPKILANLSPFL